MVSECRILRVGPRFRFVALVACTSTLALVGCTRAPSEDEVPVRPVRYAEVVTDDASVSRTYSGTAQAELETNLSFRVGGTMVERPVTIGRSLATGDLIASLDTSDFQVRLNESLAGLARAEAERRNANAEFSRTRDLYETQNASRTDLDSARSVAEAAQALHQAASQQVAAARLQLSYTTLTAPRACTIAQTFAQTNQNVSPGQPIVRVNCGSCAEVVVSVPETDISNINVGDNAIVNVSAFTGGQIDGTVTEVGVAATENNSTFAVTVRLEEHCSDVRSGMAADVTFFFGGDLPKGNLIVPYVAVGEDRDGHFVFAIVSVGENQYEARRRGVKIGVPTDNGIVIVEGVSAGEFVATAGVRRLRDGQPVTLLSEPTNVGTRR